jgi:diguanylate cyclase (GGDEF)-like protein
MDSIRKLVGINTLFLLISFLFSFSYKLSLDAEVIKNAAYAFGLFLIGENITAIIGVILRVRYKFWSFSSIVGSFLFSGLLVIFIQLTWFQSGVYSSEFILASIYFFLLFCLILIIAIFKKFDYMTGLINHRWMIRKRYFENNKRNISGLVVGDLENYNQINKNYGNYIGDKIIIEIAKRIKCRIEKEAFDGKIFRMEGDEFLFFVAKNKNVNMARKRFKDVFSKPFESVGISIQINCACGSATSDNAETFDQILYTAYGSLIAHKRNKVPSDIGDKNVGKFIKHKLSQRCLVFPLNRREKMIKIFLVSIGIIIMCLLMMM